LSADLANAKLFPYIETKFAFGVRGRQNGFVNTFVWVVSTLALAVEGADAVDDLNGVRGGVGDRGAGGEEPGAKAPLGRGRDERRLEDLAVDEDDLDPLDLGAGGAAHQRRSRRQAQGPVTQRAQASLRRRRGELRRVCLKEDAHAVVEVEKDRVRPDGRALPGGGELRERSLVERHELGALAARGRGGHHSDGNRERNEMSSTPTHQAQR
jgi:hypothetical protein